MRSLGRLILAILLLLPALDGCVDGGRGGSTGFDISGEDAAIRVALDSGQCVDFESLQYCPAEARASANTPTTAPRVNTDLATATSIDCVQAVPGGSCTYVVRFVAQGFAPGTTFQALSRVDATDNPWVLGPDPRVGGPDPSSFNTTLMLTATAGGPPSQVQFAILAFAGPPPSSTEVGQLHQAEATYAFMTQELAVNVITPPTSTPTSTLTPPATPTPGPNDCCQCESSCAEPVDGSCGTCTVVPGSSCGPDELDCIPRPTPPTPTATPVPCVDCTHVYVSNSEDSTVSVIDTSTNLVTATVAVGSDPAGIAVSPTNPFVYVSGRSGAVSLVDTLANTVFREIEIGRQPFAIGFTPDGAFVYVTDLGLNAVSIVDPGVLGQVASRRVGTQPAAIAATPDGAFVYVVNTCGDGQCFPISRGTVSIIDTHIRLVTNTLTLGYRSNAIAMNPDGRFAYVANQCGEDPECASEGTLSVIDLGTQTVADDIHITGQFSSNFVAITPDSRFAYVSNACGTSHPDCTESDGSVSVVDLLASSVVGPDVPVIGQPGAIAITPDGRTAYVTAGLSDSVVAIDTAMNAVDATIPVGRHPLFLAIGVATPPPTPSPTSPSLTPPVTPTRTVPSPTATPGSPTATATPQPTAPSGVVGTGTADSCTDAALNAALARGGLVTFDCGGPATIDISATGSKRISADTLIDGGGLVTIDGGNTEIVFQVDAGVAFTVHSLTVTGGYENFNMNAAILNDGTLSVTRSTISGHHGLGSAIYNRAHGTLTVTDSTFSDNSLGSAILNEGTLSVSNSIFSGNSGGGAILNEGTLSVSNSTFSGNNGAIRNSGTLATVTGSTFSGNIIPGFGGSGGAILNDGTLSVSNSTFSGNSGAISNNGGVLTATDCTFSGNGNSAYSGGAIDASGGTLSITNCTFSDNSAYSGGAINASGDTLSITNCTFSDNSAYSGGAINASGGTIKVTNSAFSGNNTTGRCGYFGQRLGCTGGWGGAIDNTGTLSVANSTFAGNSATRACLNSVCSGGEGGAIYNAGPVGTLTVLNSTFFENSASNNDGAIDNALTCGNSGTDPCSATLANTIVASSSSGDNCAGPITDGGHNLDDGTSCGFNAANGSLSNTDPQLDPVGFQDNGGPTQTIALQAGSPAISAGDDAVCAAAPENRLDQRGFTRPGTNHTHCSIGAYEFDGVPTGTPSPGLTSTPLRLPSATPSPTRVPTASSGVVGTGTADSCTEVAFEAALGRGGLVTFDCGPEPVTITLTQENEITSDTTIDGAGLVTLDGHQAVRAFSVASGQKFTVENLAIVNCYGGAISDGVASDRGGAISTNGGTLAINNCTFSGNIARSGGAISASGGTISVTNSTFSGNSGNSGGAIFNSGGALTVTNSTFVGNRGDNAIRNYATNGVAGTLTVANSTFADNISGAIAQYGPGGRLSTVVTNSTFADNNGLAISNGLGSEPPAALGSFRVVNSIFWNHTLDNCFGPVIDGGHNIDDGTSCRFVADKHSLSLTYPRLDPAGLQDNGGPTQTIALLQGSPAIDAGDDATCAAAPVNQLDQRGFTRPGTGHTHCSIGAYEFALE